ncbi:MAG: LytTR family transcriptional regulator DNA-binding domain-containing protein [Bacteroidales bacterium]|nr:LytTR family transcriptional regulator DNA-binding domain-containing protein [Bacteroidales bacterium]
MQLVSYSRQLPSDTFLRTGKSVIINRKYLRKITDSALHLVTPTASHAVEISRDAIKHLKQKLDN